MAPKSLKDARLQDCAASKASLNPCLRCLRLYADDFGAPKSKLCQFGTNEALYGDMEDDEGHKYRKCGYCLSNGQDCLEVRWFGSVCLVLADFGFRSLVLFTSSP